MDKLKLSYGSSVDGMSQGVRAKLLEGVHLQHVSVGWSLPEEYLVIGPVLNSRTYNGGVLGRERTSHQRMDRHDEAWDVWIVCIDQVLFFLDRIIMPVVSGSHGIVSTEGSDFCSNASNSTIIDARHTQFIDVNIR